MRTKLNFITPMLVAGAAAAAIAVAPTAAAESGPLQPVTMMGPNTSVAEQINPVDLHGGGDHGGYRGFHRGWVPWAWSPWSSGHHH
jgi:hypothetical protein